MFDKKRERRRRERAQLDVERMIRRYPYECGECFTRPATEEELKAAKQQKAPVLFAGPRSTNT